MPASSYSLTNETLFGESYCIFPLGKLLCSESVTVGGEAAFSIRLVQPFWGEYVTFGNI